MINKMSKESTSNIKKPNNSAFIAPESVFIPPRYWADMVTDEFIKLDKTLTVVVLPVAAIEQHGPHLPLKVDYAILEGIIACSMSYISPNLPVLFLPTQIIGASVEHTQFAGTLSLSPDILFRIWCEIGANVARSGLRKLLLFNSHGGHTGLIELVARELRAKHNLLVYSSSWFNLPIEKELKTLFTVDEMRFGIHAGDIETSMMLALHPQQVNMKNAQNFSSSSSVRAKLYPIIGNGKSAKLGWQIQDYNIQGATGNALAATPEKGQILLNATGKQLAILLQEISNLSLSTLAKL